MLTQFLAAGMRTLRHRAVGVCIVTAVCLAASLLYATAPPARTAPRAQDSYRIRDRAIVVEPYSDLQGMILEKDLTRILSLLAPRWRYPKVNDLLHAIRLWGCDAEFGEDELNPYGNGTPSGGRMLQMLLDDREAKASNIEPRPFFFRDRIGVGLQYAPGGGGIAHHDQYLVAVHSVESLAQVV